MAARKIEECVAQVNQLQDTKKTLDVKIEEEEELVAQMRLEHHAIEKRGKEMSSVFQRSQQLSDERVQTVGMMLEKYLIHVA